MSLTPTISLVVSDLSPRSAGRWGGAVRTFLLARALEQLGCRVKIHGYWFGDDWSGVTSQTVAGSDLPIATVPGDLYPRFLGSIGQLLAQLDGDLTYAIKLKPTSFGTALLQKLRRRRPVWVDVDDWELSWYGGDQWRYRAKPQKFLRDLFGRGGELRFPDHPLYLSWAERCIGWADGVTVHTQAMQARFGGVFVPNGKDTDLFNPAGYDPQAAKTRFGLAGYDVLMFPGAPRPYKGVEDILAAIEQLDRPNLRLVIVGGSPYDDYDRQLAERWGRWLIWLEKQSPQTMPAVVAAADAIVVPQRDTPETRAQFPLKLTDGMAMAKPTIATRVGDIPTILGDTGYLCDPEQPGQLAEAIATVLDQPLAAAAQGRAARDRCIAHYSLTAMARALADPLEQALRSGSKP